MSRPTRGTARSNDRERNEAADRILETRKALHDAAKALRYAVEESRRRSTETPSNPKDEKAFEAVFAEHMAYCWVELTGSPPRPSSRKFALFLDKAHLTLCEMSRSKFRLDPTIENAAWDRDVENARRKKVSWTEQARRALERMAARPEWDRADRYERDLWPPGVEPQIISGPRVVFERIQASVDRETQRLLREMSGERVEARFEAAAQLLAEFQLATPAMRAHLRELGFQPEEAAAILASGQPRDE